MTGTGAGSLNGPASFCTYTPASEGLTVRVGYHHVRVGIVVPVGLTVRVLSASVHGPAVKYRAGGEP